MRQAGYHGCPSPSLDELCCNDLFDTPVLALPLLSPSCRLDGPGTALFPCKPRPDKRTSSVWWCHWRAK